MAGLTWFYNTLAKRTSTFALTIIGGAFLFERFFDQSADYIFETINHGKLYKHIKPKSEEWALSVMSNSSTSSLLGLYFVWIIRWTRRAFFQRWIEQPTVEILSPRLFLCDSNWIVTCIVSNNTLKWTMLCNEQRCCAMNKDTVQHFWTHLRTRSVQFMHGFVCVIWIFMYLLICRFLRLTGKKIVIFQRQINTFSLVITN